LIYLLIYQYELLVNSTRECSTEEMECESYTVNSAKI